jgi:hypothetical protein
VIEPTAASNRDWIVESAEKNAVLERIAFELQIEK